jgi:hypothetical protein
LLRIVNLEELQGLLLRVPGVVDLQERRDLGYVEAVHRLLVDVENALEQNRLAVAGNVASLRATLLSAEQGVMPPGVELSGRPTRRKVAEAAAAQALGHAAELLSNIIETDSRRIADAERMGRQLVAIARAKGMLAHPPCSGDRTADLRALWTSLSADPEVSAGTTNVEGLVGPHDALVVFDRTLVRDAV